MKHPTLGYYQVGDKTFVQKVEAIYEANRTKQDYTWNFHNELFNAIDWTVEPETSVNEFYKIRAQQLRDNYDYIILFFSGGPDSTNVAYSFLKNGIHIDEIVAGAPVSGLNDWKDSTNPVAANTISETRLVQIPELQELSKNYPNVKITIHDYFQDMLMYKTDEWLWKSGGYIHPTFRARYSLDRPEYDYLRKLADSGKKIALVYGIDKPTIVEENHEYLCLIRDIVVNNGFQALDHPNATVELFYYTPDLPLLMIKQAHVAARYISLPENFWIYDQIHYNSQRREQGHNSGWRHRYDMKWHSGTYQRGIVPAIYPMLEKKVFQGDKPRSMFWGEHDAWFGLKHRDTRTWELMKSDFNLFIDGIDPRYYLVEQGQIAGFTPRGRYYNIGPTSKFKPHTPIV